MDPPGHGEVIPFFADARNLQELTPPWLRFEVLTPSPVDMKPGRRLVHSLFVKRNVSKIFDYRSKRMSEIFGKS